MIYKRKITITLKVQADNKEAAEEGVSNFIDMIKTAETDCVSRIGSWRVKPIKIEKQEK